MSNTRDTEIEDLKSTALDILNNTKFGIKEKIDFLISFKLSTVEHMQILRLKKHPKKRIKPFELYSEWLGRQLDVLRNNGTHIVK